MQPSCNPHKTYGPRTFSPVPVNRNWTRSYRFGLLPFRSPLLRECFPLVSGTYFLFLRLLRCFSSPGYPASKLARPILNRAGFPIRKSLGQRLLATSPKLIAGCYVLHRLLMSRHSPYTLNEIFPTFLSFKNVKL